MDKPTCANCKYFVNYLYKKDAHLISLNIGHCTEKRLGKMINRYNPYTCYCAKWEEKEEVNRQTVFNILNDIDKKLEELVLVLKE